MRQKSQQQLENQVNTFNAAYKVGDKVNVLKHARDTETFVDEITYEASVMGGHSAMTWLKGKGSYELSFVVGKVSDSDNN